MTAWSHLPNAAHINQLLNSLDPETPAWDSVWSFSHLGSEWDVSWSAAHSVLWDGRRNHVWITMMVKIQNHVNMLEKHGIRVNNYTWAAIQGILLALIIYDNCGQYLNLTPDQLVVWNILNPTPAGSLLYPMVCVQLALNKKH